MVRRGRTEHAAPLRLFWWPPYRPEWNPEELLNQEGKSNAGGRRRPADRPELIDSVRAVKGAGFNQFAVLLRNGHEFDMLEDWHRVLWRV